MYERLNSRVFVTRLAAILTVAMLFNIFIPFVKVERTVRADANSSNSVDLLGHIDQCNLINKPSAYDPNGVLSARLFFTVPKDGSFNADHPYLVYDFRDIIALKLGDDNQPAQSGSSVINLSTLNSTDSLSGNIVINSHSYPYRIETNPSDPMYGFFVLDLSSSFDSNGDPIVDLKDHGGSFNFSLGLDANSFEDNAASYVLRFSTMVKLD